MSSETEEELREQINVLTRQLCDAERKIMTLEYKNKDLNGRLDKIREQFR